MEFEVLPGHLRLVLCRADGTASSVYAIEKLLRPFGAPASIEQVLQDVAEPMFRALLDLNAEHDAERSSSS